MPKTLLFVGFLYDFTERFARTDGLKINSLPFFPRTEAIAMSCTPTLARKLLILCPTYLHRRARFGSQCGLDIIAARFRLVGSGCAAAQIEPLRYQRGAAFGGRIALRKGSAGGCALRSRSFFKHRFSSPCCASAIQIEDLLL